MKRALAVLGAIALIGVAFAVRGLLDGDGAAGGGGGSSGGQAATGGVVCPAELAEACRAAFADVTIEAAGSTLERLAGGEEPEAGAWVVSRAHADVLATLEPQFADLIEPTGVRSSIVAVVWESRLGLLEQACGDGFGLSCLGDVGGRTFAELGVDAPERVQVGFPGLRSMTGFDVVAAGASAHLGSDQYASNDFGPADLRSWLTRFLLDAGQPGDPLNRMLTEGPGRFTVVLGSEADLAVRVERAASREPVRLLATGAASELVVVGLDGDPSRVAGDERLRDALVEAGWTTGDPASRPLVSDPVTPTEPTGDGLAVKDGVLAAVRDLAVGVA